VAQAQGSVPCALRWKPEREAEVKRRRGEEDRAVKRKQLV